jgi:hypothetical protein
MPGYRTWATNDIPSAADFNELHADPLTADVVTQENTTSTAYTDLATTGPAVTKTLVNGQKVWVIISARQASDAGSGQASSSFAVSGATTLAAADANAAELVSDIGATVTRATVFTATASGSHTFTMKYKRVAGTTAAFLNRRITVKPF